MSREETIELSSVMMTVFWSAVRAKFPDFTPPKLAQSEYVAWTLLRDRPEHLAPRDAQDLMAYPFFSLAKSKRLTPIDFKAGSVKIRVEAVPEHGMATIWDADVLIWAASQIVEARDVGLRPSRLMATTPYEILNFIGRGVSLRDYDRLKAALDRLQSTTIATSIRQPTERRMHRFSWINEWKERADHRGTAQGALAADDGGHRHHVIGVGGVAHPEEEAEHHQGEQRCHDTPSSPAGAKVARMSVIVPPRPEPPARARRGAQRPRRRTRSIFRARASGAMG